MGGGGEGLPRLNWGSPSFVLDLGESILWCPPTRHFFFFAFLKKLGSNIVLLLLFYYTNPPRSARLTHTHTLSVCVCGGGGVVNRGL